MESKDESKEIDIKIRACYYFDDIIKDIDINFSDILLNKKLHENVSVYVNVSVFSLWNFIQNFNGFKTIAY